MALVGQHGAQQLNSCGDAFGILAGHSGKAPALCSDGQIERFVTLLAQLVERHISAHFDAAADVDAQFAQHVDFSGNDIFLQLVRGDTIGHHAARQLVLLEHCGRVSQGGKVVCACEACGSAADDGDLLLVRTAQRRLQHGRDETRLGVQVALGNEFLHGFDGHCIVDGCTRAGVFAAVVAHTSADGGEGVFLLDEGERLCVAALCSQAQIALDANMRRAGNLAGSGARVVRLDTIVVAVVGIPFVGAPRCVVGQLVLWILDRPVQRAQPLSEFHGAGGAVLHALSAGNACIRVYVRHVGRAAEVRSVEQLARAQAVANRFLAVAHGEDLLGAVDVGNLVHEAEVLGLLDDFKRFLVGDVATFAGLHLVVGHIAHADAPALGVVARVHAAYGLGHAARAHSRREAVVLFEPMRNVLDVDRRLDLLDGLLDGHDVHADAAATWRDDVGDHRGSQICDALEVGAHLGMLFEGRLVHGVELAHAGQLHGQREALFVVRVRAVEVLPVVLEVAFLGHEVHERLDLLERPLTSLGNLLHGHGMPNAHVVGDVGSFLGED